MAKRPNLAISSNSGNDDEGKEGEGESEKDEEEDEEETGVFGLFEWIETSHRKRRALKNV